MSKLEDYIKETTVIPINDFFKVRLSNDLYQDYLNHLYDVKIALMEKIINNLISLDISFKSELPVFYLYIVPNENFKELLDYKYDTKGGGRPVKCFDFDGLNYAFGISANLMKCMHTPTLNEEINLAHELAHLLHMQYFINEETLSEGFAEALTFYNLSYEEKAKEHRDIIFNLSQNRIYSINKLINLSNNNSFYTEPLIKNSICSYEPSYISSYLFIRGLIKAVEQKYNLNKNKAAQVILEIISESKHYDQFLIFELAEKIGLDAKKTLNGKELQLSAIEDIKKKKY